MSANSDMPRVIHGGTGRKGAVNTYINILRIITCKIVTYYLSLPAYYGGEVLLKIMSNRQTLIAPSSGWFNLQLPPGNPISFRLFHIL